jgi:succinate dehydrogenase / fumarate reductase, cytochrome b subunit
MNALTRCLETYWSSSIGKKLVVALTGLFLILFLAGHLVGNLVVFMGPEPFNAYAYFLHHMLHGVGIWVFRILMLVMFAAHIIATVALTKQNKAARKSYEHPATIQASKSSRYMILTGLTILVFFIYHMLHFTARIGNEYNNPELYKIHARRQGSPQRLENGHRRLFGLVCFGSSTSSP